MGSAGDRWMLLDSVIGFALWGVMSAGRLAATHPGGHPSRPGGRSYGVGAGMGLDQDSGRLGSAGAWSGHLGLTPSGLEALTTYGAGRDDNQGLLWA